MSGRSDFDLATERRILDIRRRLAEQIRTICFDGGVSRAELARAAHLSPAMVSLIVRQKRTVTVETLAKIAVALDADAYVNLTLGAGIPIHDRFQAPMVEAFLAELHPRWAAFPEVAVRTPARGSIDLVFGDRDGMDLVASEFVSCLRRSEQQLRWSNEKAAALRSTDLGRIAAAAAGEPGRPRIHRLLVLRSTAGNRRVIDELAGTYAASYPVPASEAVAALRRGSEWPGSAMVWMTLHGRTARLIGRVPAGLRSLERRA